MCPLRIWGYVSLYEHMNLNIFYVYQSIADGILFFSFFFGRPMAYGVPGQRSDLSCSSDFCQIPNPLCQARDQTCVPALQRHCQSCCATAVTPSILNNVHIISFSQEVTLYLVC